MIASAWGKGPTRAISAGVAAPLPRAEERLDELARICRDLAFDQADIDRMAAGINGKVAGDIGAKRLPLLTAAQRDARALAENPGCASAEAQELLALYDADLAGAVD